MSSKCDDSKYREDFHHKEVDVEPEGPGAGLLSNNGENGLKLCVRLCERWTKHFCLIGSVFASLGCPRPMQEYFIV